MYRPVTVVALAFLQIHSSLQDPLVDLPNGQIQGREDATAAGVNYYAFEKIPYAAPPVDDLRFKPPQPVKAWNGVLNTTKLDVACYQLGMFSRAFPGFGTPSEDCLYLNVYTTKLASGEDEPLLPVMVWIHGGGFVLGSALMGSPDLFINNDVILVSINYRLGVFGFISTQDTVIPGNNGLKDQVAALQWIQENIRLFGGDPNKVTIFGQSAGGGSCAYQLLNTEADGLFAGAILESGTFLSPGMFQRNSKKIAFGTGGVLDPEFLTSEDSEALLELLLRVSANDLNAAAQRYSALIANPWDNLVEPGSVFAPVVEAENPDAFLSTKQYSLVKNGKILSVPVIMGFNSEEKIGMVPGEDQLKTILQNLDENIKFAASADMHISDDDSRTAAGEKIREIYTGGEPFADHIGKAVRYSSDNFLSRAMVKHAELASQVSDIYFYQFSFEGELDRSNNNFEDAGSVTHGAELDYLFCSGESCGDTSIPEADLLTRERLITLWTNFAKYQNPTPERLEVLQNVTWPVVSPDGFVYLDINDNLDVVKAYPKEEFYEKWIELYDSLGYDDFDTY